MEKVQPNRTHEAVSQLWGLGLVSHVITQSTEIHSSHFRRPTRLIAKFLDVDSLHHISHPTLPTTELHGTLRDLICLTCRTPYPRTKFQQTLACLNPKWADFLKTISEAGASDNNNSLEKNIKRNPDGDVDLPGAPYTKFRYPPCPKCLEERPRGSVLVDADGAHVPNRGGPTQAILKPGVIFFGESISSAAKEKAEVAVKSADGILVLGSSLATYSAWRLVRTAHQRGIGIGIVNLGGVRGEDVFFADGAQGTRVRIEFPVSDVLGGVVQELSGGFGDWDMVAKAAGSASSLGRYP